MRAMGLLAGLRSVLSFLTVLPVGHGTVEEMAEHAFFFPMAGAIVGFLSGLVGAVLFSYLDPLPAAWLTLIVLSLLTGLNHLDGVLDLGDALMVRGDKERRIEVLHDKHHGVGGFVALLFTLVLAGTAISLLGKVVLKALVAAETMGKLSMILAAALGRPGDRGIGAAFISKLKERILPNVAGGIAISVVLCLVLLPIPAVAPISALVFLLTLTWTKYLERVFGCITGDMLGATCELNKLAVLFALYGVGRWGLLDL